MVSTCPLILVSSSPFNKLLRIIPSTPITTGITVFVLFHSVFALQLDQGTYLSFFFSFISGSPVRQSSLIGRFANFCWFSLDVFIWPWVDDFFVSEIVREFVRLNLLDGFWFEIKPLFRRSNLNFLHDSQWISFPSESCIVLILSTPLNYHHVQFYCVFTHLFVLGRQVMGL